MKKAVFFDIDGTLMDEHGCIPESTKEAVAGLRRNGHAAFICTGRTKGFVRDENLLSIGFDGMIAGCGTYIEYSGKEVFYYRMENEKVQKSLSVLKKYEMPVILEGREYLYMDYEAFKGEPYAQRVKREMGDYLLPITGNEAIWEISKFSAAGTEETYPLAVKELEKEYDVLVHGAHAIEFVPKGFSKASGIKQACEMLDIPWEATYAVGDSVNDLEMLSYVAHGIAMGNAGEEAKNIAEYVTSDIHEDGILNALQHYNLI